MPHEFVSGPGSIEIKERHIIDDIVARAVDLEKITASLEEAANKAEANQIIRKMAFNATIDAILDDVSTAITAGVAKACYESKEFNYDLYVSHLLGAVDANKDNILSIQPNSNLTDFTISLDLSVLGTADEWFTAISQVRDEHGWGKTRGKMYPSPYRESNNEDTESEELASRMWREKIYKPGREGGSVTKTYVVKTTDSEGNETKEYRTKDVTAKYRGKYRQTVEYRLGYLGVDRAPFWYLIEHGNVGFGEGEGGGVSYPTFPAAHMENQIEVSIRRIFDSAFKKYLEKADEALTQQFHESYGIQKIGRSFKTLDEDMQTSVEEQLKEPGVEFRMTDGGEKIGKFMEDEDYNYYRRIARNGRLYISRQSKATGRWVAGA